MQENSGSHFVIYENDIFEGQSDLENFSKVGHQNGYAILACIKYRQPSFLMLTV